MQATPNEIEVRLGLSKNSLTVMESGGVYSFAPTLTPDQERIAIALLTGNEDEKWAILAAKLRGTPIFAKAYGTNDAKAWAMLLASITGSRQIEDLLWAFSEVRAGMPEDFTPEEIAQVNQMISSSGFDFQIE